MLSEIFSKTSSLNLVSLSMFPQMQIPTTQSYIKSYVSPNPLWVDSYYEQQDIQLGDNGSSQKFKALMNDTVISISNLREIILVRGALEEWKKLCQTNRETLHKLVKGVIKLEVMFSAKHNKLMYLCFILLTQKQKETQKSISQSREFEDSCQWMETENNNYYQNYTENVCELVEVLHRCAGRQILQAFGVMKGRSRNMELVQLFSMTVCSVIRQKQRENMRWFLNELFDSNSLMIPKIESKLCSLVFHRNISTAIEQPLDVNPPPLPKPIVLPKLNLFKFETSDGGSDTNSRLSEFYSQRQMMESRNTGDTKSISHPLKINELVLHMSLTLPKQNPHLHQQQFSNTTSHPLYHNQKDPLLQQMRDINDEQPKFQPQITRDPMINPKRNKSPEYQRLKMNVERARYKSVDGRDYVGAGKSRVKRINEMILEKQREISVRQSQDKAIFKSRQVYYVNPFVSLEQYRRSYYQNKL